MPSTVREIEVERQPEGALLVRWVIEGAPAAVDISTGVSPDHIDHVHAQTVTEAVSEALVAPR